MHKLRTTWSLLALLSVVTLVFCTQGRAIEKSELWGDLQPGKFGVGFKVISAYDYARAFHPKTDFEGKVYPGETARPLQISIWYPAKASDAQPMHFGEYIYLTARETVFGKITETDREQSVQRIMRQAASQGVSEEEIQELLAMPVAAVRQAPATEGKFPLIVFAQGFNQSPYTNFLLGEYFASHGYVVASSPSMGRVSRAMIGGRAGVDTQTGDVQFIIASMHNEATVDPKHLGLIGFSFGGHVVSEEQMRNMNADAVISLDGSDGFAGAFGVDLLKQSPYFDTAKMRVAFMRMNQNPENPNVNVDKSYFESLRFGDKYDLTFHELRHIDFTSMGMVEHIVPNITGQPIGDTKLGYELVCRYALHFMNAYIRKDAKSLTFLQEKPEAHGAGEGFLNVTSEKGQKPFPVESEFMSLLNTDVEKALQLYKSIREADPNYVPFRENTINVLGYQVMPTDRKKAIAILQLNTLAFPSSANTYDSLAEAYMNDGQTAKAIEYYEKALEAIPGDKNINPRFKQIIEQNAPVRIKQLKEQLTAQKD